MRERTSCVVFFILLAISICNLTGCDRSKDISNITEPILTPGWITFKKEANVNPKTLFKEYAGVLQLKPGNDLVIVSEEKDELGMTHYRYQQFFKNIPVEDAEFIVHSKNDRALTANGNLAMDFEPTEIRPAITEEDAFKIVMKRIPAERYFREDDLVGDLQNINNKDQSEYRPKGKLIFAKKQNTNSDEWVLAWVFNVFVLPFDRSKQVFINASDGSVLKELPLFGSCAAGSGDTTFRGNQQFNTKSTNDRFYLINDCNDNQLSAVLLDTANKRVDVNDDDNNWNANNRSLVTSYWALDILYDYFRLVHNRKSYDNKNGNMTIFNNPNMMVDGTLNPNSASGGNGVISIGFGSTTNDNDDYNTIDIVGHEFGHSLIEKTANLGYDVTQESAALNESFSDIFGQIVERWEEQNANADWVIGDDKGCTGGGVCRDLKNPKANGHPDTYKGTNWMSSNIDPHVNGTVQNRWFYLITDGGTGTNNETGTQYSINGIGIEKARKIAYRTLTAYLNSGSDYKHVREGSIHAAEDLYGSNSQEVGQVTKAWCAVGLCAYTQPKGPDRYDKKGGNPNPSSPDNNNSLSGATPLGTGSIFEIGNKVPWTKERYPKMFVVDLNIYPFDDVDYFKIIPPNVQNPVGGECATTGYSFAFTNNVNAKIYSNGSVVASYTNAAYFVVEGAFNLQDFAIAVLPAFPGQILDYDMQVSYFFDFDTDCYQAGPRDEWELIQDCIMCNLVALRPGENVILDPPYRNKYKVPVQNYYFYHDGESNVDIPVRILKGNNLQAQLIDKNGNVIAVADNTQAAADRNVLHLTSDRLSEGVYSLRFTGFGNGTEISVGLPGNR